MKINQAISADQLDEYLEEEKRIQDLLQKFEKAIREGRRMSVSFH